MISAALDKTIQVWDIATAREERQLSGHSEVIWSLELSQDGKQVITSGFDGTRVRDFTTGKALVKWPWGGEFALSPDGRTLAFGGGATTMMDIHTGKKIGHVGQFPLFGGGARFAQWSPDGRILAIVDERQNRQEVVLWEVASGIGRTSERDAAPSASNQINAGPHG